METSSVTQDYFCALRVLLNIPVVHDMSIDLHALIMNNFENMVLRIEHINTAVQRCASWTFPLYRPSRSLEKFLTQGFQRIDYCCRKVSS